MDEFIRAVGMMDVSDEVECAVRALDREIELERKIGHVPWFLQEQAC